MRTVMSVDGSGLMIVMNSNQFGSVLPSAKNHVWADPGGGSCADAGAAASGTSAVTTAAASRSDVVRLFTRASSRSQDGGVLTVGVVRHVRIGRTLGLDRRRVRVDTCVGGRGIDGDHDARSLGDLEEAACHR